jgi:hypothetical protein
VDVVIPGYEDWDAATRRLWRAALSEAGVDVTARGRGRYTIHRNEAARLLAAYKDFIAEDEEE